MADVPDDGAGSPTATPAPTVPTVPEAPAPRDDPALHAVLAAARPDDAAGAVLARAKIASQLFGTAAPGLGRFRVLERLGAGGMGTVYAAYDPELDRGVALKTIDLPTDQQRDLGLREAKALARLAHPNVVAVFDVGLAGAQLYIVMELVRGPTLRAWAHERDAASIAGAYRQAAQGLAAAHDAGLVHRDFKPDNAIVGTDGRVRVVDFGLAVAADAPTRGAGTPTYMAPEQAAGGPASPRADQYSLCVALREALGDARPRWLDGVLARGADPDPAARFASMHELVRALGRDPIRVRRQRALAGVVALGLVGVGVAAFAIGRRSTDAPAAIEPCTGADRELARAWTVDAEHAALARVASRSAYGGELAPHLAATLADFRARWIANHREACLAHHRGEQSDALLDRRMACLDRSRAALQTVGTIVDGATAAQLADLSRAAAALPAPDACAELAALADARIEPPPPARAPAIAAIRRDLAQARVERAAGRFAEARVLADRAIAAARAADYAPVLAEAQLIGGRVAMDVDDVDRGVAELATATTTAVAAGDDAIAVEAWARRAWLAATNELHGDALDGRGLVEALAARARAPFATALLANNLGSIALARGELDAARASFARAIELGRALEGSEAIEIVNARTNLALVTDDAATRVALFEAARAELARRLGPHHPDTLAVEWRRVMTIEVREAEAEAALASLCALDELHPALAVQTATCLVELAELRAQRGDRDGALAAGRRALELGPLATETPEIEGLVALWSGDLRRAETALDHQAGEFSPIPDEPWYRAYARAKLAMARADVLEHRGQRERAGALRSTTREVLKRLQRDHPQAAIARRIAAITAPPAPVAPATR